MKRRIVFLCGCAIWIAICAMSMFCPNRKFVYLIPEGDCVYSVGSSEVDAMDKCELQENGMVNTAGSEAYLDFYDLGITGKCIQIQTEGINPITHVTIFWGKDGVFKEEDQQQAFVFIEDGVIRAEIPEGDFDSIRFSAPVASYRLISFDFYDEYREVLKPVYTSMTRYLAACAATVFAMVILVIFELKLDISRRLVKWLSERLNKIIVFAGITLILGAVAFMGEWIISSVLGIGFRKAMFWFVYAVLSQRDILGTGEDCCVCIHGIRIVDAFGTAARAYFLGF